MSVSTFVIADILYIYISVNMNEIFPSGDDVQKRDGQ